MVSLSLFRYCPKCGSKEFVDNNIKSKKCLTCGFVYYLNPSAACAAFIKNERGELLVGVRSKEPAKGTYDLIGGFTDFDETLEEALIREVKEETNLTVDRMTFLFSIPNEYEYSGFIVPTMDCFFEVEVSGLDKMKASDDVCELLFIPQEAVIPEEFGLLSIRKAIEQYTKR